MNKNKRKKRSLTLIEVMIVILLIGLIGGALAYNMSGSMDQGRAFKTEQTILRVHDILMMEYAMSGAQLNDVVTHARDYLMRSPLVKRDKVDEMLRDGWNNQLVLRIENDDIVIQSTRLDSYKNSHAIRSNN